MRKCKLVIMFDNYFLKVNNSIELLVNDLNESKIYDPIKYFLKLPSKRIRPIATIISNQLFNSNIDYALPAALANEVFHNFTLIHDDIMDSSKIRRGKETVHLKWDSNQAILSGDSMLILSYKLLEKYPQEIQKPLLKLFNDTALLICEGQQLDIDFEKQKDLEYNSYIKMIKYKTAVLLGSSLKMGAVINNVDNSISDLLYECGINLGLAFQIQDDYLDLFGSQKLIGKKVGGDIVENKKTILYHICYTNSNSKQKSLLNEIYDSTDSNKIENARKLFKETKADLLSKNLVKKYSELAISQINDLDLDSSKKLELVSLSKLLLNRKF